MEIYDYADYRGFPSAHRAAIQQAATERFRDDLTGRAREYALLTLLDVRNELRIALGGDARAVLITGESSGPYSSPTLHVSHVYGVLGYTPEFETLEVFTSKFGDLRLIPAVQDRVRDLIVRLRTAIGYTRFDLDDMAAAPGTGLTAADESSWILELRP